MSDDARKLTVYYGERTRAGRRPAADAITGVFARHGLAASVLLRGAEGFGRRGGLRTDRQLTLSEDLPLISVAVDERERIEAAAAEVEALGLPGLRTVERIRLGPDGVPPDLGAEVKLTVYLGRHERAAGRPAYETVVAALHAGAVAGASVLLGVDGTLHGERRRARLVGANTAVPLTVVAVGAADRVAAVLPRLSALLPRPLLTLERVDVLKRDGAPALRAGTGGQAPCPLRKLTVYAGEQSRHRGAPLSPQLVRALRAAGAAGATSLRGIWGYHGDHAPHGDTFRQLRRRVPVVTAILDTPERIAALWPVVDAHTDETGLVTGEDVPVVR